MTNQLQRLFALFVFTFLCLGGCSSSFISDGASVPVRVGPQRVIFHPETGPQTIEIQNISDEAVALGEFRIEGGRWKAFAVTEQDTPPVLPAGASAQLTVTVDPDAMLVLGEDGQSGGYQEGGSHVTFAANGREVFVPLRFEAPSVWAEYVVPGLIKTLILVLAFVMPLATALIWLERKQSAMMQDRLGPNMARIEIFGVTIRLWGALHIVADAIKMLFKEDFVPARVHRALYTIAPLLAFAPALLVFAIVPFGDGLCYDQLFAVLGQQDVDQCVDGRGGTPLQIAHIDVGLLYYFAIASLATYGTTLAGWSSYNKWAMMGGLRATAQMISYEVAIGLTIVGALLVYGSLEPHALVRAQEASYWGIVLQPAAFVLFFIAAMAETKRAPFDLPEGESEIIGYFIEYSGMRFGLFMISEFVEIVFMAALLATLFFGGWALPFDILGPSGFASVDAAVGFFLVAGAIITITGIAALRASRHAAGLGVLFILVGSLHLMVAFTAPFLDWGTSLPHIVIVLIGMITWGIKIVLLCWLQLLVRWTLPRFRYDQLMSLGWKGLLPLSIANVVITAIVVYWLLPAAT